MFGWEMNGYRLVTQICRIFLCWGKEASYKISIIKVIFYYIEGHHTVSQSKFLTMVLNQGCSSMWHISPEGQVLSLTEVFPLRVRMLGQTLQSQGKSRWCLSRCMELNIALRSFFYTGNGHHGVLRLCLVI